MDARDKVTRGQGDLASGYKLRSFPLSPQPLVPLSIQHKYASYPNRIDCPPYYKTNVTELLKVSIKAIASVTDVVEIVRWHPTHFKNTTLKRKDALKCASLQLTNAVNLTVSFRRNFLFRSSYYWLRLRATFTKAIADGANYNI